MRNVHFKACSSAPPKKAFLTASWSWKTFYTKDKDCLLPKAFWHFLLPWIQYNYYVTLAQNYLRGRYYSTNYNRTTIHNLRLPLRWIAPAKTKKKVTKRSPPADLQPSTKNLVILLLGTFPHVSFIVVFIQRVTKHWKEPAVNEGIACFFPSRSVGSCNVHSVLFHRHLDKQHL